MDAFGVGFLVILSAVVTVFVVVKARRRSRTSRWPTVEARIETSSVDRWGAPRQPMPSYVAALGYAFEVNGERYGGIFGISAASEATCEDIGKESIGKSILVRYDPKNPTDCETAQMEFGGTTVLVPSDVDRWRMKWVP